MRSASFSEAALELVCVLQKVIAVFHSVAFNRRHRDGKR